MSLDLEKNSPPDNQCHNCHCKDGPRSDRRNLVVCIDGTSNQFSPNHKNTNVIELYRQLVKDDTQLTYYDSGIGTYAQPSWKSLNYWKQVVDNKIDLAIAWNFEALVLKAYSWLADNYQPRDRIFLFGFSRGAYQCRALAGMIYKVGLIHRGNERQIPFAYEIYADSKSDNPLPPPSQTRDTRGFLSLWHKARHTSSDSENPSHASDSEPQSMARQFKDTFSRDVKVHFVGAWDTVSSIGVIRGKNLPGTVSPEHICFFRHALALDERRVKFMPEYARGGVMLDADATQQAAICSHTSEGSSSGPPVKETWFTGTHSDIGGGNVLNPYLDRSSAPLLWMSYEAISAGLLMERSNVEWKWEELGDVHESLTGVWKLFEYFFFKRLSYKDPDSMTWRLHRGRGRKIQPGQKIHATVAFSPSEYRPKAVLPKHGSPPNWEDLIQLHGDTQFKYPEAWKGWLEMDIFDLTTAQTVISNLESSSVDLLTSVHRLTVMTQSAGGRGVLRGVTDAAKRVFRVLQRDDIKGNMKRQVEILDALIKFATDIPGISNRESLTCLLPMLRQSKYHEIVQRFITKFCQVEFKMLADLGLLSTLEEVLQHGSRNIQKDVLRAIRSSLSSNSGISPSDTLKNLLAMLEGKEKLLSLRAIIELANHGDNASEAAESLVKTLQDNDSDARRLAFLAIEKLLRRGNPCRMLLIPNLVKNASNMLKSHEGDKQRLALDIIIVVVRYEEGYGQIMKSNALTSLSEVLGKDSWILRCCALEAIIALAKYGDFRSKMVEMDVLARLFDLLQDNHIQWLSIKTITALVKFHDFRSKTVKPDVFARLFGLLQDSDWGARQSSVEIITSLAEFDDLRSKMVETDVLVRLVGLLQDQDSDVRQSSIKAISSLAKFDNFCSKMVETNNIARLVGLLQDQDKDVRQSSIKAITALAKIDNFRSKMVEIDILAQLVGLLQNPGSGARRSTIESITALGEFDDFRSKMVETDIFSRLFGLLQDQSWGASAEIITALTKFDDFRSKMVEEDVLARLVRLLCLGAHYSTIEIINALAKIDDFCSKMVEMDVLACLVGLLQDQNSDVCQLSIEAITALAKIDDFRSKVVETDVITHLVGLLQGQDSDVCQSSVKAITALATFDDFHSKMVETDVIACLVGLLQDQHSDICQSSIEAITALAKIDDLRFKMVETGNITCLVGLLQDSDSDGRQSSVEIITALAEFDDFYSKMMETDVLDCLFSLLQDSDWRTHQSSVQIITALAEFDDFRFKMVEADIITCLVGSLQDSDSDHQSSVEIITALVEFDDFRSEMMETNILVCLFDLLQDSDWRARQSSAKIITALAEFDDFRSKMVETDGITHLVGLLQCQVWGAYRSSVEIITALVKFDNFRSKIAETDVIARLVGLLQDKDPMAYHWFIEGITSLAEFDDFYPKMIEIDVIACLVDLLRESSKFKHESSAMAIITLVKYDSFYSKILETGVFFNLVNSFHRFDLPVQVAHFLVITAMINSDHMPVEMLDAQKIQPLVMMIEVGDPTSRQLSTEIIGRLAKYACLRSFLEVGVTPSLVNNLNHDKPEAQCSSIDCVTQFAEHDVLDTSRWPDVFKVLLPVFYSNGPNTGYNGDVQEACFRCICQSSERDNCRSALLEAGLLRVLMGMLEDSDHRFRMLSLKAIAELVKYDDFRELLCEYIFMTSMVGIVQVLYCEEQCALLDAVGELAKYEETRSRLLCSRFISCLVATLSKCSAESLPKPKRFPPELPQSFITCIAELEAHEDSRSEMTKCGFTPSMLAVWYRDSAQQRDKLN